MHDLLTDLTIAGLNAVFTLDSVAERVPGYTLLKDAILDRVLGPAEDLQ